MRIHMMSVFVDDQATALEFYTSKLGFEVRDDIPMGQYRWIALTAPGEPDGPQLILEPSDHRAVRPFTTALVQDGIPFASFAVENVAAEHARLVALGVRFVQQPTDLGPVTIAVLDDESGNLIQIAAINEVRSPPQP